MTTLAKLYIFLIPFQAFAIAVAGSMVEPALMVGVLLAICFFCAQCLKPEALHRGLGSWLVLVTAFVLIGAVAAAISPYGPGYGYRKSIVQVVGIMTMVLTALALVRVIRKDAYRFMRLTHVLVFTVALLCGFAIWQFVALNLLGIGILADWSILNSLDPQGGAWRRGGRVGPVARVSGYAAEPAFLGQFILLVAGLVFLRLGLAGRKYRRLLRPSLSLWVALLIAAAAAASFSIVAWTGLLVAAFSLHALTHRISWRVLKPYFALGLASLMALALLDYATGNTISDKATSVALIGQNLESVDLKRDLSAMALSSNLYVAAIALASSPVVGIGFGLHPAAYADLVPEWMYLLAPNQVGLNSQEAGALSIRLLSETGLLGFTLFICGWLVIVFRARRAILSALETQAELHPVVVYSIGITASCIAVTVTYLLRLGLYYAPSMWVMFGLTAAIPLVLQRVQSDSEQAQVRLALPASGARGNGFHG